MAVAEGCGAPPRWLSSAFETRWGSFFLHFEFFSHSFQDRVLHLAAMKDRFHVDTAPKAADWGMVRGLSHVDRVDQFLRERLTCVSERQLGAILVQLIHRLVTRIN